MAGTSTPSSKLGRLTKEVVHRKMFEILQVQPKMHQGLQDILNYAAEAFNAKSYKAAAKYYTKALDSMTPKNLKITDEILIKYMLCLCGLESTDAKDISDSLKNLEELKTNHGRTYPMFYYAVAQAYFKLYRFNKADQIVKEGFGLLNGDVKIIEYCIPGTKIVIPESSKERLVAALVKLNEQCSSWHRPDAVCCMPDCSTIGHNEGADKNIFFGSPTFNGMVQVTCDNPSNFCTMSFHLPCWKAKKEQMCSLGKISDKDVVHTECFTPNCENQGARCRIKKIEIFDENAQIKATIEPRTDESSWHAKATPPPKGAIRKQQQQPQQPKLKVAPNEARPPFEKHSRPPSVPHEPNKVYETEEDDDLHDEIALKAAMENLKQLRGDNFYVRDEMIWRPDLSMYGNEYMLATAEALPDPDFSNDDPQEQEKKAFIFSYFYTFLSNNGPIKLDGLEEKWNEAKKIIQHCDSILNHHLDISEFLLQSLKFAVVGNYICTADKLPVAYHLSKTDTCEIVKFFMEHDIDQQSSSSSIDDEAIFNHLLDQEKNNNSLPYSTIPDDDKSLKGVSTMASNLEMDTGGTNNENRTDEPENSKIVEQKMESLEIETKSPINMAGISAVEMSLNHDIVEPTLNRDIVEPTFNRNMVEPTLNRDIVEPTFKRDFVEPTLNRDIVVPTLNRDIVEPEKSIIAKTPVVSNGKVRTPRKKNVNKRSHSPDLPHVVQSNFTEQSVIKIQKENIENTVTLNGNGSPKPTINGTHNLHDIENQLRKTMSETSLVPDKFVKTTKSTSDLEIHVDSLENIRAPLMNHSEEPGKKMISTNENIPRESQEDKDNKRSIEEAETDTSIVAEVTEAWHKMNRKLVASKEEIEQLKSQIAQARNDDVKMKKKMLQKMLHHQYACNNAMITAKLEEAMKNYEATSGIQKILANSTGQILPINVSDWSKIIDELNNMSSDNLKKFTVLSDQLCTLTDVENCKEMELPLKEFPKLPKYKLTDLIHSAFGLYHMHLMKEFQQWQPMPMQQPQVQPMFRAPPKYAQPIDYQQNYLIQNNPGMPYSQSQSSLSSRSFMHTPPPLMHSITTQQAIHIPMQQKVGLPLISNHPQPPPLMSYTYGQPKMSIPIVTSEQLTVSLQQSLLTPVQQTASYQPYNSNADVQTNTKFPIVKSDMTAMEQTFFIADQKNGQNSEKPKFFPSQQPQQQQQRQQQQMSTLVPEQSQVIPAQQRVTTDKTQSKLSVLEELQVFSSKFSISQSNAQASVTSSGSVEKKNHQDLKPKWNENPAPLSNTQSEINMHIVEGPLNCDSYANPEGTQNDYEMTKNETIHVAEVSDSQGVIKLRKKGGHSMDKLMRKLRSQYPGVLEMDLLKSVESVRKMHNNSLSRIPMLRIIREADKIIGSRQQKQLCGYEKHQQPKFVAVKNSNAWNYEGERKRQTSVSSTSSVNSGKSSFSSKKQWEPVTIPNDGWVKETQESECAICFDSMPISNESYSLQCKHTFHKKCIKDWYKHNQSCPTCRVHSTIDDEYPPLPLG